MKDYLNEEKIYFNNRSIIILRTFPNFNLAIVKYEDTDEEFPVDLNFITKEIIQENFITIRI